MTKAQWQQFLKQNQSQLPMATSLLAEQSGIMSLTEQSVIRCQGVNNKTFLQGQLSCDVTSLSSQQATLGALCNPKGRVITNFWLWRQHDDYYLLLPTSMQDKVIAHLQKYGMFSKVVVNLADELLVLGLINPPDISAMLKLPTKTNHITSTNNITCLQIPGLATRYLLIIDFIQAQKLWQALHEVGLSQLNRQVWDLIEIQLGLATITPSTSHLFLPQMINLDQQGGISFTKGCYVGQEIIARTQHLGKLKRHLQKIALNTTATPTPGSTLINHQGQSCGIVVNAALDADKHWQCLAVMQDNLFDPNEQYSLAT